MIALIAAVFAASLLGSLHCAGMCGAFLAFAVAPGGKAPTLTAPWMRNMAYNGGRLATYMLLGVVGGAVGAAVDLGGSAVGLQRSAALLAGAAMIVFGVVAVLRAVGARLPRATLPEWLQRFVAGGHRAAMRFSPTTRALTIGVLTPLLPCGWLYAFVITAAGTADPVRGAVTMAAFWAGTLPMMVSLGVGLQAMTGPLRRRLPLVTSLVLVGVGVYTVAGRMSLPARAETVPVRYTGPVNLEAATERVRSLDQSELPCCNHERDHR